MGYASAFSFTCAFNFLLQLAIPAKCVIALISLGLPALHQACGCEAFRGERAGHGCQLLFDGESMSEMAAGAFAVLIAERQACNLARQFLKCPLCHIGIAVMCGCQILSEHIRSPAC